MSSKLIAIKKIENLRAVRSDFYQVFINISLKASTLAISNAGFTRNITRILRSHTSSARKAKLCRAQGKSPETQTFTLIPGTL